MDTIHPFNPQKKPVTKKILFVDDEPNVLAAFQRQLYKQFSLETASSPEMGLAALKNPQNFAVVVADMRMPNMNGVEFLTRVKEAAPEVVRMMLTGNADQATAIEAINRGHIFRFLNKPCPADVLIDALDAGLRQHQLIIAERELLEQTLCSSIKVLTDIMSISEPKAFAQAGHLRDQVRQVANAVRISETWALEAAAMLAHIGRVTIPPEVALKMRVGHPLSPREQEMIQRIPDIGAGLLAQIPRMEEISRIILYQKKHYDGSGSPKDEIRGDFIPFGARLLKVLCDLMELEASGVGFAECFEQMKTREGWYDPQILETARAVLSLDQPSQTAEIPFAHLRVGQILRKDVFTRSGVLVVSAGYTVTETVMERLQNFAQLSGIREPIFIQVPRPEK